ncbi:unnamed protein product [Ambrosiozyma monospora]|uniref:Unnamed protein product n=1 Tax=Ambrosiozyma monospora TaxID=43982 RepID=A0ACB5SSU9_AMBMO|nr:unnamed protein product [Ambrosiozyma monospora]
MENEAPSFSIGSLFRSRAGKEPAVKSTKSQPKSRPHTRSLPLQEQSDSSINCQQKDNQSIVSKNSVACPAVDQPPKKSVKPMKSHFSLKLLRDRITGREHEDNKSNEVYVETPKLSCVDNDSVGFFFAEGVDLEMKNLDDIEKLDTVDSDRDDPEGKLKAEQKDQPSDTEGHDIAIEQLEGFALTISASACTDATTEGALHEESPMQEIPSGKTNTTEDDAISDYSAEILTVSKQLITEHNQQTSVNNCEGNNDTTLAANKSFDVVDGANLTSLYVGDLSKNITELDLKEAFGQFSGFVSVKIPLDSATGVSLCYAYVNFLSKGEAETATEALNYTTIKESEIRIMPSLRDKFQRERIGANVFLSNLPPSLTTRQLFDKFKLYGKILSCKLISQKLQGFIHFEDKEVAYHVVKTFNHSILDGKLIYVGIHILKKDRELFGQSIGKIRKGISPVIQSESTPITSSPISSASPIDINSALSTKETETTTGTGTCTGTGTGTRTGTETGTGMGTGSATSTVPHGQGFSPQFCKWGPPPQHVNRFNWNFQQQICQNSKIQSQKVQKIQHPLHIAENQVGTRYSIFVRNLPLDISDSAIYNLVLPYGPVLSVLSRKVPSRNGSWALVTLSNQDSVDRSILCLNTLEIDGHRLFVTRAIPKEEKGYYINKLENTPKMKLKILITGLNVGIYKEQFESWCSSFGSIVSVELFQNAPANSNNDFTAYGYVEMSKESDADKMIENLKLIGVHCFKVKIEIPRTRRTVENNFIDKPLNGSPPIDGNSHSNHDLSNIPVSYVVPSKLLDIALFNQDVETDRKTRVPSFQGQRRSNFNNQRGNNNQQHRSFSPQILKHEPLTKPVKNENECIERNFSGSYKTTSYSSNYASAENGAVEDENFNYNKDSERRFSGKSYDNTAKGKTHRNKNKHSFNNRQHYQRPEDLKQNVYQLLGNFAASALHPSITFDNLKSNLSILKVRCLTEHIVKFYYSNKLEDLFEDLEKADRGYHESCQLINDHLVEAASYLGIVSKS